MTDRQDVPASAPAGSPPLSKPPRPLGDEPGFVDGIPVEELVRLTKEFTARITNEDRQRLSLEVRESGRTIQDAPFLLRQFFTGKIDLDIELARRFPGAPLLSSTSFTPAPGKRARLGFAQLSGQDGAASLSIEIHGIAGTMEASFLLSGMIGVRFTFRAIADAKRHRFLEQLRRPNGIEILWSRDCWEGDHMVFVIRERFARVYAFGAGQFEAACRLTPDGLDQLITWLSVFWLTEGEPTESKPATQPSTNNSNSW